MEESGEGLIKMLLDSSHLENKGSTASRVSPSKTSGSHLSNCGHTSISLEERLVNLVQLDHSYAKPWRPQSINTLPSRGILLQPQKEVNTSYIVDDYELLNVDEDTVKPVPQYDSQVASKMMNECDKFVVFANPDLTDESIQGFEESIPKDGWTQQQKILYHKMMRVLHQDRLARLANQGRDNEPILRRIGVDKAAKRARLVLSSHPTLWDLKTVQWLHTVFTNYLPKPYLAAWLDILQTLRSKVPKLVDKVLAPYLYASTDDKIEQILSDGLRLLLKRPWDPVQKSIMKTKLEQLPGNPIIIVAPPGPGDPHCMPKRMRLWNNQLGCLGKVIVINLPIPKGEARQRNTVNQYLNQIVTSTLTKVRETKSNNPDRPIILMGWGPGASIITHVASIEKVAGLVCLGFASITLAGRRGELGDPLLDLKTPTLFVIGDKATNATSDDIEDFREKISVETGLIVVGSADNNLRVSKRKKRMEGITQAMVDRNLMDEIREFLSNVLTNAGGSLQLLALGGRFSAPPSPLTSPRKLNLPDGKLTADHHPGPSLLAGMLSGPSPKKIGAGVKMPRKRNSSAASLDGAQGQLSPNKRKPQISGGFNSQQQLTGKQKQPKKPRKSKKQQQAEVLAAANASGGAPDQVNLAAQFPPGLLSISSPLPPSTLVAQQPGIRVPSEIRIQAPVVGGAGGGSRTDIAIASVVSSVGQSGMTATMPQSTHIQRLPTGASVTTPPNRMMYQPTRPGNHEVGSVRQSGPGRPPISRSTISITLPLPVNQFRPSPGMVSVAGIPASRTATGTFVASRGAAAPTSYNDAGKLQSPAPVLGPLGRLSGQTGVNSGNNSSKHVTTTSNVPVLPPGRFTVPVPSSQLGNVPYSKSPVVSCSPEYNTGAAGKVVQYIHRKSVPGSTAKSTLTQPLYTTTITTHRQPPKSKPPPPSPATVVDQANADANSEIQDVAQILASLSSGRVAK